MIRPGLYVDVQGLLAVGEARDGEVVAVRVPLDLDGLEGAAHKILDAVRSMRARTTAAGGGERPRLTLLRGGKSAWN